LKLSCTCWRQSQGSCRDGKEGNHASLSGTRCVTMTKTKGCTRDGERNTNFCIECTSLA
jgi:hypothetical protein